MRAILLIGLITSLLFTATATATATSDAFPQFEEEKYQKVKDECFDMMSKIDKEIEKRRAQIDESKTMMLYGFWVGVCMASRGAFGTTLNPITRQELKYFYLYTLGQE